MFCATNVGTEETNIVNLVIVSPPRESVGTQVPDLIHCQPFVLLTARDLDSARIATARDLSGGIANPVDVTDIQNLHGVFWATNNATTNYREEIAVTRIMIARETYAAFGGDANKKVLND